MKYLIVQDWPSTHGNHAGMLHMCNMLVSQYPNDYKVYVKKCPRIWQKHNGLVGKLIDIFVEHFVISYYHKTTYPKEYIKLCQPMFDILNSGDEVFLLEYLIPWVSQYELALYIRSHFKDVRIYGLSHLTVNIFEKNMNKRPNTVIKWIEPIDKILTLGSSLSSYFNNIGILKSKISTGFHYVDNVYYHKLRPFFLDENKPLTIITMGALQRDYNILAEVVRTCKDVHWIICKGHKNIDNKFIGLNNVDIEGFLDEDELRKRMDQSDISLNILEDTIGSNVITTSMAMGLAIIVSDVGSIHDYCSNDNTIFCHNNANSFIKAINLLCVNREMVFNMRLASALKSKSLVIEHVNDWFSSLS